MFVCEYSVLHTPYRFRRPGDSPGEADNTTDCDLPRKVRSAQILSSRKTSGWINSPKSFGRRRAQPCDHRLIAPPILHPEYGAQNPLGESLYRECICEAKASSMSYVVRTIGSRLATRAYPRCLDSKGDLLRRSRTLCTYVLLRIGSSLRLIDMNSRQTLRFSSSVGVLRTSYDSVFVILPPAREIIN